MRERSDGAAPIRLADGGPDADPSVREAGRLLRLARLAEPLDAAAAERVRARIAGGERAVSPRGAGTSRRLAWVLVVAATVLLGTSGLLAIASSRWRQAPVAPSPSAPAGPAAHPVAPRRMHIAAEPSARLDAVAPAARPAPGPIATRADRDATTATLAEEAKLLALGLRQLRNDGDAEAALVTFAAYLRRFPDGALAPEADIGRVEALIALDRYDDALAILDGLPDKRQVVRGRELASLRGELRARAGRCAEAESDFARVLRQSLGDGAEERALIGRANCRSRSGDVAGARADLAAYLQRFPDGRFATETRRALGP